jgi:GTP-dependent dephospho-CoA kinase
MAIVYTLGPETRKKLKDPFGTLIRGPPSATLFELQKLVRKSNPPAIVSVGDMVSTNLLSNRIIPQLVVTDNKCMRKKVETGAFPGKKVAYVRNPAGTITEEAIETIKESLKTRKASQIIVEGEEDLLALIVIKYAPENTLVLYGQPNEGIVAVKASQEKKSEVESILEEMKTVRKAK